VVDASDPTAPVVAAVDDTPGEAQAIGVAGGYTYMGDGSGGLFVLQFTRQHRGQMVHLPLFMFRSGAP
jgi:hypothetical protein